MLSLKSKGINIKTIAQYSRRIFSITQPIPNAVTSILEQKRKRQLTQKQQRQIYEQMKQKNIFPTIVNPKTLIELCADIQIQVYKQGKILIPNEDCFVILDGAVKIFQEIEADSQLIQQSQGLRKTSLIITSISQQTKIEQKKIGFGEVLAFDDESPKYLYITAFPTTMLKISKKMHTMISSSTYMIELKRKLQFFNTIPLFQKHYRWSLNEFVNSLQQIQFGFGKRVFTEGQNIDKIFIVKQGQFLLEKNVNSDQIIFKQGKLRIRTQQDQNLQSIIQDQIKLTSKHYRACPYKIVGPKQIIGDSQYMYNDRKYLCTMKCHKEGSILYSISIDSFFKKLLVAQNPSQRVNKILQDHFQIRKKQIQNGVKFNQQNSLILRFMPNSKTKYKTFYTSAKERDTSWVKNKHNSQTMQHSQRSWQFFQKMNKTIINQNGNGIRKRNDSKQIQKVSSEKAKRKIYKTPAVVQEVVHIVNQKKAYHKLRNLGVQKKGAFQFNIDNVPPFIKKKYAHIFNKKSL